MKKIFSVICALCVLLGLYVSPIYAAEPTPYDFFDDFESYSLNTYPAEWQMIMPSKSNKVYVTSDAEVGNGQFTRISCGVANDIGIKKPLPKLTGKMVFEGDFRQYDYKTKQCPYFYDSNGTIAISVQMTGSFDVYYGDPLRPTIKLGSALKNSWHHIKMEIDIDKNIYNIYVDGILEKENVAFRNKVYDISMIKFGTGYVGDGMAIDNIKITGEQTLDIIVTEKSEQLNNDTKRANAEMWNDLEMLEYQIENPQYTLYSQDKLDLGMAVYVDNKYAIVRNNRFKLDEDNENVRTLKMNGECMIPAENFAEYLVGEYSYDGDEYKGEITYINKTVEFYADGKYTTVDGKTVTLRQAPVLVNDRLYASLADMAEIFELNLYNDGNLYIVTDKAQTIDTETDADILERLNRFFETRMVSDPKEIAYYVSPNGRNCWSGTKAKANDALSNGPFRTIERAREAARSSITDDMNCDITIYIEEGQYYIDETLVFDNSDGGKNWCYVTYKNYNGGKAVINGGEAVTDWEPYTDKIYRAYLGERDFEILSENGDMVTKARYPNAGKERTDGYLNVHNDTLTPRRSFEFKTGDIPELSDITDLEIYIWPGGVGGYRNWFTDTIGVTDIDYENNIVSLASDTRYAMESPSRYFLQGHLSFLDVPGEYYFDTKSGYLYYYPKTLPIEEQIIVVPKVSDVVEMKGENGKNPVRNIILDGIGIKNANYKNNGCGVRLSNTANCRIKNCQISSIGYIGIITYGTCMNNIVYGNDVFDIGSHGIYFESGVEMGLTYYQHDNTIENNHIHNTGKVEGHGGGLTLTGTNCIAKNNKIDDTGRGALAVGMGTSKLPSVASEHTGLYCEGVWLSMANVRQFISGRNSSAKYNEVSNANLDSSDMGVFYVWGGGIDVDVSNNYFHDSDIRLQFGYCIYLDDACDMYTIKNNVIESMQMKGEGRIDSVMFLKGVGNKAINNYIINNPNAKRGAIGSLAMAGQQNNSLYLTRNVAYNSGDSLHVFENWETDRYSVSQNNMFYNPQSPEYVGIDGAEIDGVETLEDWKNATGFDKDTLNKNPEFMDADNKDFRFKPESLSYQLGVQDLNLQDMGLNDDFIYVPQGENLSRVYLREMGKKENSSSIDMDVLSAKNLEVFARSQNGYVVNLDDALVTYSSSSPEIASVDDNGKITAKTAGKTKITVTVEKDGYKKSSDIYVYVGDKIASLVQSDKSLSIVPGANSSVLAVPYSENGRILSKAKITYMSDNTRVATVDEYGIVYAKSVGNANIKITAKYADTVKTVSIPVTVCENTLKYITAKTSGKFFVNVKTRITPQLFDFNDTLIENADYAVTYESSDENIAIVDKDGVVTGISEGNVELRVNVKYENIEKSYRFEAEIYPSVGKDEEVLIYDDFDDETTVESYELTENTGVVTDEKSGEKFMQIGIPDVTTVNAEKFTASFDAKKEKIGVSADLYISGKGIRSGPVFVSSSGVLVATIQFRSGGIFVYYDDQMIQVGGYPYDSWFNIKCIADLENKMFDIYLNDEILGSSMKLRNNAEDISAVYYNMGTGVTGMMGVDNLKVFVPQIRP